MDLDDFIIAVFCVVDEAVPQVTDGHRLRQRGPQPILADSEVVTMEVVGEYLGLERESALFASFRRHYAHFFPALRTLHRTTFVRQAANLWRLKERLWHSGNTCWSRCRTIPPSPSSTASRCRSASSPAPIAAAASAARPLSAKTRWCARPSTASACMSAWSGRA